MESRNIKFKYPIGTRLRTLHAHLPYFKKNKIYTVTDNSQGNWKKAYSFAQITSLPDGWSRRYIEDPVNFRIDKIFNWKEVIEKD